MVPLPPIFVNANGSTIRIDPPNTPTGYTKFCIYELDHYDESGYMRNAGRAIEIYIPVDPVKQLRDALSLSVDFELRKMMGGPGGT